MKDKTRIYTLDLMRGIAAILVVSYHLIETYMDSTIHIINHGYLAVDFFFILSGFVVSYAYDLEWGKGLGYKAFFYRRLVRLHPMVLFASVLGTLLFFFQVSPIFPVSDKTNIFQLLRAMFMGMVFIPSTELTDVRGWGEMFCLNSPQWTLFFEYIANILYALFLRRLSNQGLFILTFIMALVTVNLTLDINICGLIGNRDQIAYTVIGGWCSNQYDIFIGFSRLMFPFCCGMLIQRNKLRIQINNNIAIMSILLVVILAMPKLPGVFNGIYESICILIIFPLIIMLGNGGKQTRMKSICTTAGELSYPLYIVHFPFVYLQTAWVSLHPQSGIFENIEVTILCLISIVTTMYLSYHYYETPIRNYIKNVK